MKKYFAEFVGTFMLVLLGCGAAVFAGAHIGQLGIACAFGLALVVIAYTFGNVSGAHVNPAVSFGMLLGGRLSFKDFIGYFIFQLAGATLAAFVIKAILCGKLGMTPAALTGLGQNGWGEGYGEGYSMISALLFELIGTFIFVRVILKVTTTPNDYAGLAIGLALLCFHLVGIQITGVSLNPARSFGPAVFVQGLAWDQLWLFFAAPLAGGFLAGLCARFCPCCKCDSCGCDKAEPKKAPAKKKK